MDKHINVKGGFKMRRYVKVDIVDPEKERKMREFKEKLNQKFNEAKSWVVRNKELIIYFTPIIITGVTTVVKVVGRHVNLRKAESVKNLYCYDRSLGHYWSLRRELTNREWIEIDKRKKNGERLADILSEMKVLK